MKKKLQEKIDSRAKPVGSLGKLEDIALKVGMIQNSLTPELRNPAILLFAGDHGLVDAGVSVSPKETTYQMMLNFVHGGAGINVFTRQHGISLKIIDAGVDYDFPAEAGIIDAKIARGTKNMLNEAAMSLDLCKKALAQGRKMVQLEHKAGCNVIGFGEMGIGNSSSAALLLHKYAHIPLKDCVGAGAGLSHKGIEKKYNILKEVADKYSPSTPLEILACFGGFEIAMICGAVLEAKDRGMLIIADGFITSSAFLAAYEMQANILENTIFSHHSDERGHKAMLDYLKGDPILNLGLRLGEGTGVAIAYPIIESALIFLNEMESFEGASVFLPNKI